MQGRDARLAGSSGQTSPSRTCRVSVARVLTVLETHKCDQVALTAELTRTPEGKLEGILLMPLGLPLPEGGQLKLDDTALGSALPFSICIPQGCLAPLSFEADTIAKSGGSNGPGGGVSVEDDGCPWPASPKSVWSAPRSCMSVTRSSGGGVLQQRHPVGRQDLHHQIDRQPR